MATGNFLTFEEEANLVTLIADYEKRTSGEIHIHLANQLTENDILIDAQKTFLKLELYKTKQRNAVLIFVAPNHRKLACVGDQNIHHHISDQGWKNLISKITSHFKENNFYQGLKSAVDDVGQALINNFPSTADDPGNELPDEISKS